MQSQNVFWMKTPQHGLMMLSWKTLFASLKPTSLELAADACTLYHAMGRKNIVTRNSKQKIF